jgi:ribosomal protein S6
MSDKNTSKQGGEVYELGYLLLPSIAEDKVSAVTDKLKKTIVDAGGTMLDSEEPFLQDLAYSMSKTVGASRYVVSDAYLGWMKFDAPAENVPAIKDAVEMMEEVLRSLLIKAPRESEFTFAKAQAALLEIEKAAKEEKMKEAEPIAEEVVQ